MIQELRQLVGSDERILFEGTPDKRCYIFEAIFNPMLMFSIVWLLVDLSIVEFFMADPSFRESAFARSLLIFLLVHLMPVYICIIGVILTVLKYKHVAYVVTQRAVYVAKGVVSTRIQIQPDSELVTVEIHRGQFDHLFNVGDIVMTTRPIRPSEEASIITIDSIKNHVDVYKMIKTQCARTPDAIASS